MRTSMLAYIRVHLSLLMPKLAPLHANGPDTLWAVQRMEEKGDGGDMNIIAPCHYCGYSFACDTIVLRHMCGCKDACMCNHAHVYTY